MTWFHYNMNLQYIRIPVIICMCAASNQKGSPCDVWCCEFTTHLPFVYVGSVGSMDFSPDT